MPSNKAGDSADNVKVVVRCRPLNDKETAAGFGSAVEVNEVRGQISVKKPGAGADEPPKVFTFDTVFSPNSKQVDVYNLTARPIVDSVLQGYNGTIFAYGQTGTGKTFTMEGIRSVPEFRGIIPNSFAQIFGHIAKAQGETQFLVRVSYYEIYNEEVRDLLGKDQHVRHEVKERPDIGVYVKDLSMFVVKNADEMDQVMTLGNKNRSVGATNMNEHSSRSHAIFSITAECSEKGPDGQHHVRVGKLHLVDLAGSERQTKTGSTGQRLKEATKINLSLSTLGNVISALVDGKSTHIPYRNSKLTRLLQDSLGGNSKTMMCANIGPASYNYDETISTLRYANRAKNIKNRAVINEDPKDALLRQFQKEIEDLKKKLAEEGGGGGSDDESDEEFIESDGTVTRRKHKGKQLSSAKMQAIQEKIEEEKKRLLEQRDMAAEQRNAVKADLAKHEEELKKAKDEHDQLQVRLKAIERKVIIGGVDLLKKAEEQEKLLEESNLKLQEQKKQHDTLRKQIEEKEAERINIEEKYNSLQEEAAGKTRKLKKVYTMLMATKAELEDIRREHQREVEALLDGIREISYEVEMQTLICDAYIPRSYYNLMEEQAHWNEEVGEWQMRCIAYTGNNMRRPTPKRDVADDQDAGLDLSTVYLAYTEQSLHDQYSKKSSRSKSKSARKKKGTTQADINAVLE